MSMIQLSGMFVFVDIVIVVVAVKTTDVVVDISFLILVSF